jgi:hypothetical protein
MSEERKKRAWPWIVAVLIAWGQNTQPNRNSRRQRGLCIVGKQGFG